MGLFAELNDNSAVTDFLFFGGGTMYKINVQYVIKSWLNNKKIKENVEIFFLNKSPSKRSFTNGIHRLVKRADARECAQIIYRI